jgi:hypothetical protein
MVLPLIAAGVQTALGAGQMIAGGAMRKKAQKQFDANKYEVPGSIKSMLDVVRGVASQRDMPGYDQYLQKIGATTAQGVEAAQRSGQSSSDVLGALSNLYGRQMSQQQDMAIANAQNYQRNQMQLAGALQTMGGYEDQKWNYNVLYPYMQQMTAAGQVAGAGSQNLSGGIGSAMSIGMANSQMQHDEEMYRLFKEDKFGQSNSNVSPEQLRNLGGGYKAPSIASPNRGYPQGYTPGMMKPLGYGGYYDPQTPFITGETNPYQ